MPNAAVNPAVGPVMECSESVWDKIFEINVKSTFLLIKEFLPYLRKSISPSIVIMSSISGYQPFSVSNSIIVTIMYITAYACIILNEYLYFISLQLLGVYSITKTTLLSLNKTVAEELASEGIRVNAIAPGVIKTKFAKAVMHN